MNGRVGRPWTHLLPLTHQNYNYLQSNYENNQKDGRKCFSTTEHKKRETTTRKDEGQRLTQEPHTWAGDPQTGKLSQIYRYSPNSEGSKPDIRFCSLSFLNWEDELPEPGFVNQWGLMFRRAVGYMKLTLHSYRTCTKSHFLQVTAQRKYFEWSWGQTHLLILESFQEMQDVTGTSPEDAHAGSSYFWKLVLPW